MTLFIACLLVYMSGLSPWFYAVAVWLWVVKKLSMNLDAIF